LLIRPSGAATLIERTFFPGRENGQEVRHELA
jgi:hypothetical protein